MNQNIPSLFHCRDQLLHATINMTSLKQEVELVIIGTAQGPPWRRGTACRNSSDVMLKNICFCSRDCFMLYQLLIFMRSTYCTRDFFLRKIKHILNAVLGMCK